MIWKRAVALEVAGLPPIGGAGRDSPRIAVSVARDGAGAAARCQARIYNLSRASEKAIDRGGRLTVRAGYGDNPLAQVFAGVISRVTVERDPGRSARIVTIHGAGEDANPNKPGGGRAVFSFVDAGIYHIIREVAKAGDLRVGPLDLIPYQTLTWAISATVRDALDDLDNKLPGVTHYIHDNELRWTRGNRRDPGAQVVRVTPKTGLIGTAAYTDEGEEDGQRGVAFRSFFRPQLTMGATVDLRSEAVTGMFKVVQLRLSLDNWEGAFASDVEGNAVAS